MYAVSYNSFFFSFRQFSVHNYISFRSLQKICMLSLLCYLSYNHNKLTSVASPIVFFASFTIIIGHFFIWFLCLILFLVYCYKKYLHNWWCECVICTCAVFLSTRGHKNIWSFSISRQKVFILLGVSATRDSPVSKPEGLS
jgi:uncharacterized membrane protein